MSTRSSIWGPWSITRNSFRFISSIRTAFDWSSTCPHPQTRWPAHARRPKYCRNGSSANSGAGLPPNTATIPKRRGRGVDFIRPKAGSIWAESQADSAMLDHVSLAVADFHSAKRFYAQALAPLGMVLILEKPAQGIWQAGFGSDGRPFFWIVH